MELLNLVSDNLPLFLILVGILVINFCCIIYLVLKEKKEDKEEIEELLSERNSILEEEQDAKVEENKKEVEEMLMKMQQDLETKPEDVVTNFENEQEEKSIISYQELLESVKQKQDVKATPVKIEEIDEQAILEEEAAINELKNELKKLNEPEERKIEIKEEVEPIFEEEKEEKTSKIKEVEEDLEDTKKFKSTDFISPIFGRQENNIKYPTVPKNNTTKIEEFVRETEEVKQEITKNESFLKALKDFRKNLD